jgi:TRAP-type C4-dicarboxylate transport system permease small subunit
MQKIKWGGISNILSWSIKVISWITAVCIVSIIVMIFVDVLSRNIFVIALPIVPELTLSLMIVIIWTGAIYTLDKREHVEINVLTDALSPIGRKLSKVVACALSAFCCGICAYSAWFMFERALTLGAVSSMARIPMAPLKGMIVISFCILTLQFIGQGWEALREIYSLLRDAQGKKEVVAHG